MSSKKTFYIFIIIISQFFCTSLWFATNAVLSDLTQEFKLDKNALQSLSSIVQFGFIAGTLTFAFLALADKVSATLLFFINGLMATVANLAITFISTDYPELVYILRFMVGFFLAGIYPIGMKIASDHFKEGLGKVLGFLVGALVLGTAFPHLIKSVGTSLDWRLTLYVTCALSGLGSIIMYLFIPDASVRTASKKPGLQLSHLSSLFKNKPLRNSALGYMGHMFELYTFWAFVPVILGFYLEKHPRLEWNVSLWSFLIIAIGCLSCALSGFISAKIRTSKTALLFLSISGLCCIISPLSFLFTPPLFLLFLMVWGFVVIGDSPMFSTLVAQNAEQRTKGTALTLVNSLGFSLTILSIFIVGYLIKTLELGSYSFIILALGPVIGLYFTYKQTQQPSPEEV